MRQIVILSGKGGTGKTSVTAALAQLATESNKIHGLVLADADVDAANLDLVLHPNRLEEHEFMGGSLALIDADLCQGCGNCEEVCRFGAIIAPELGELVYSVDQVACDGCASCVYACPESAIQMETQIAGSWFHSDSRYGALFHAQLHPGQENSGKLVTLVKQQARLYALDHSLDLVLVDGPPGIGCPVISAASGADMALIIAEPTMAGIHDMERALQTTRHFRLPSMVVINKADISPKGADQIRNYCLKHEIELIGEIPFDENITQALVLGEPVTAWKPDAPASQAIQKIWESLQDRLIEGKVEIR
ncbi:MAG TPA: ATP-binding protein [Anaerolineales bacterium]|nr:ATP-binding protein [Anaerolineales bacterium]